MCWWRALPYSRIPRASKDAWIMQATSLACADEPRSIDGLPAGEVLPLKIARSQRPPGKPLWPEAITHVLWRAFAPVLHGLRSSWIYRHTLHGALSDRVLFHPDDPRPRSLEDADTFM